MNLDVREIGAVAIVDLDGHLTMGRGEVMLREVVAELLRVGRRQILLNLSGVGYMDSAGIGEMVACAKRAEAEKATLKLLHPSRKVREMLHITRFEELFESYSDEDEALQSF